jgi:alpha-L-fucosidase
VRELVARYRPSVLWGDISWPSSGSRLAGLLAEYYAAVPDGVVNDRFMPWSPAFAVAGAAPVRRLIDGAVSRASHQDRGIIPPKPPMFDVRTPEYTVFPDIQATPWECVRGIDKSFGHNRASDESHFLGRRDLLWSVVDIAAKNGNLLLNVGPRGEDATIAPAQLTRLDWLAEFAPTLEAGLVGTRPWVRPAPASPGPAEVRYVARDRSVIAFARAAQDASAALDHLVLGDVAPTPTTRVCDLSGAELEWAATSSGIRIATTTPIGAEAPIGVELVDVVAR